MRRFGILLPASLLAVLLAATPALACGGLIGPNGAVNLLRTTTLAGYHDGVEHYVTAFQFAGGGGAFGSITPLPDVPTSVVKGGDWTLQRLIRETDPPAAVRLAAVPAASAADGAEELMKVKIDALDLTVLRGGAADIGAWAKAHGFRLPPDAPEVLDFYANRSPIFLAAAFDADAAAARGQQLGDGTPVHITIPTDNPWVPLRILALGKAARDQIQADVYLLTDDTPALLPKPLGVNGIRLDYSASASDSLLTDLRSDRGMEWIPSKGWLTKIAVDAAAGDLTYDLAIDVSGAGAPSRVDAGFELPNAQDVVQAFDARRFVLAIGFALMGIAGIWLVARTRPGPTLR
jgi:hypothetical protein